MHITLTPEEEKLYVKSIAAYGTDAQLEQYAEECLEAALAVRKFLRAKKSNNIFDENIKKILDARKELYGEIIDTMNMSIQMKLIMLEDKHFDEIWQFKINRQIDRVNNILNPQLSK